MERARIFRKLKEHAARGEAVRRLRHPRGRTLDALRCATVKTASKSIHAFAVSVFLQFSQPVLCRPLAAGALRSSRMQGEEVRDELC